MSLLEEGAKVSTAHESHNAALIMTYLESPRIGWI